MKQGWEYKKFSEIFDLQMGRTPARDKKSYWEGDNLWVSIGDMGDCKYISHTKESISDIAIKEAKMPIVPPDTALMSFKLSIGKTAIASKHLCTNEAIMAFIPKEGIEVSSEFLYYYLSHYKWEGNRAAMGKTINKRIISDAIISLPPISEQHSIVAELDKINEIIDLKKAQLKDLDLLAQSIFYDMFGDPIENPKGWEVKKLGDNVKVIGGYAFKSKMFANEGIPVLRIGNINSGVFKSTNMVFWEEDSSLKRYEILPGDLVMSLTGTVGKSDYGNVCVLSEEYPKYYLNQRNAKIEIISNIEKYYLAAILKNEEVKSKLTGISRGVRQANISNKDIESLQIPLPPLSLQQSFAEKIQAIESQKSAIKQSLAEVETLLASRMDYWFN